VCDTWHGHFVECDQPHGPLLHGLTRPTAKYFANYPLQHNPKQLAVDEGYVDLSTDRAIAGRRVLKFSLSLPNATADSEAAVAALFDTNVDLKGGTVGCRINTELKVCPPPPTHTLGSNYVAAC
jgi:hypothetical protein